MTFVYSPCPADSTSCKVQAELALQVIVLDGIPGFVMRDTIQGARNGSCADRYQAWPPLPVFP